MRFENRALHFRVGQPARLIPRCAGEDGTRIHRVRRSQPPVPSLVLC